VVQPNFIKPTVRCVNDNNLRRFFEALRLLDHIGDGVIETCFVLADYND
jgi:hypothetical protein